ncbi:PP2C family protein-serine/threonine phosphatase [Candidatus Formimonas warabiya]|uniref:Serine/threonine protein phosphatase n=1 Tax=Formimonas warabiya TaxID=1761012 RepID=A0A3G1KZC0_FORW1|nr:SpoIIE family protein phosphatase [Candidatus Formimonas warabiya]ATW27862.1 serine/threonine protein phosphatase [Candidatus Formimonas warabiya]
MKTIIELVIALVNSMSVIMVLTYVLTRSSFYGEIMAKKFSPRNQVLLVLIFGAFSIYGTLGGMELLGAIANIRDLGPTIAGLIGGPMVGLGAGLIGGLHRFTLGGFTCYSCSSATVLAGLIGGGVYLLRKGAFPSIKGAVLLSVAIEIIHFGLALLISKPFSQALTLVKQIFFPMILANGAGMAVFAFMLTNLVKERATENAKRQIEGELHVAREIQMSIVPRIFPPFPERAEFEIHALLEPAKEVGGDFYDFFFIDEHHLFFVVGDVSGKGVPASLFMAVTRTLLRSRTAAGSSPHEILDAVNNELCRDNDTGMFVTIFCGILDTNSGEVFYSCGGHDLPYHLSPSGIAPLAPAKGPALGAMDGILYQQQSIILQPGDTLILYTDGVTEAMSKSGQFWGKEGLLQSLQNAPRRPAAGITGKILQDLRFFARDTAQYDDITLLALTFTARRGEAAGE